MKAKAHKKAELFNPDKSKDVHHIFPKSLANKYNIPTHLIRRDENAIALERDFHDWIHGKRFTSEDEEIEWKGFDEDDYIFLAVAYLGIAQEYFDEKRVYQRPRKSKQKRHRKKRR